MSNPVLWSSSKERADRSQLKEFMKFVNRPDDNYQAFHAWSVDEVEEFWNKLWDFCDVIGEKGDIVLKDPDKMTGGQFFPNGSLNYAQNLLRRRSDEKAIIFRDETGKECSFTFNELYDQVSLWAQGFKAQGVKKGDRVAAYMPNMPETIIACLAATSLGAVFSSASPDFGVQGLVDRFGQIEPKILVSVDGYHYGGKEIDCLEKIKGALEQIPSVQKTVIVPFIQDQPDISGVNKAVLSADFLNGFQPQDIEFEPTSFNDPLFIMFSSGTTGVPKCIVHGHGGTLLQHLKEHQLHCDVKEGDPVFYFTTCGWMMWNWLITGLASGATLLLYDGNPFYPDEKFLWEFTSKHKCKLFGTAAKYIDALKKAGIHPKDEFDLSDLDIITSTGSPLVHESFDYVYNSIKKDVHLASISGGTDIISCFVLGNPLSPVYRGEIQGAGLGMAVEVKTEDQTAQSGELVCTKPFPSMPVGFWGDEDGKKYHAAYFDQYPNVWSHGDWIEKTTQGGYIIHGRSDATLNPGGVRIGTAEIYRQVEKIPQVLESIAVGQDWEGDVRVILFVRMKEEQSLDEEMIKNIKMQIREGATPRHVPAHIVQISDIPRTKSGKITELAVRDVIHGRPIKNKEALANPEALDLYQDLEILLQSA
ncbi:MAG: acetoacetate--CoA ligase [Alphaproteobacteria bacterium]|nr:acetoacetate--CoA ligase [Alphaproteobacteria bacterium]